MLSSSDSFFGWIVSNKNDAGVKKCCFVDFFISLDLLTVRFASTSQNNYQFTMFSLFFFFFI